MDKKEPKKITLGLVLGWIFGVFFALGGLGMLLSGNIASGIAILLAGLILLPPITNLMREKMNFELSTGLKTVIVIVLIIVSVVAMPDDVKSKTGTTDNIEETAQGAAPDNSAAAPTPAKEEQKVYHIGDSIRVDDLSYKVTNAETFTKMGTSFMNKETKGKFVKVYLEITNEASASQYIYSPRFKLVDVTNTSSVRMFDRLTDDMLYIEDSLSFGEQLQPGLAKEGAIIFEVPKDAQVLALQINGDWKSTKQIYVVLPNIKDIGVDTTQKTAQDAKMNEAMADGQRQVDEMMQQYK